MPLKIFIFFLCKYRMVDIKAETWNKAGVSTIKIHENDNVDKTVLLFFIFLTQTKDLVVRIFMI